MIALVSEFIVIVWWQERPFTYVDFGYCHESTDTSNNGGLLPGNFRLLKKEECHCWP
jgi:hypothetical protein